MTHRKAIFTTLALTTLLVSCTVGPKYTRPSVPAAPAYSEQPPASYTESNGWKTAQPSDATLRGDWWNFFGDPQLDALEVQVPAANQTLRAAEASFRQAKAAIRFNRSALYPTISAGPDISANRVSANNPIGTRGINYGGFVLPFDISYEADLWGRIRRSIAAARENYQASAADFQNVKLILQSELAIDYFEAHSLDAQKELLDNNVIAFEKALQLTQNRYNGGVASKAEVTQAQTQLNQTQAQDIDVEAARAEYEHAIAVLIGKNPEEFKLPAAPLKRMPPVIPTGVPSQLLERRPDIAIAERRMAAQNEQIGIARAAFFPQLLITAVGGLQSGSIVDWFTWPSRYWAVGPQVAQYIFDAGRRRAQLESVQAGYDITVADYRQSALTAFREVEDNLAVLRILEQESAKQQEAIAAAENSVELAINRYKGGLVTYLEVITAQNIALTNQRTGVDLLRRRMDASVLLIRALGGGWDTSKLPQG
ncbi:MAG: efflux transporter outer membrane subunit [Acidobacteriaceae bacterium]|nr:efflux transporter outer membrane subunit [Acidobacteriaceae bacterium]